MVCVGVVQRYWYGVERWVRASVYLREIVLDRELGATRPRCPAGSVSVRSGFVYGTRQVMVVRRLGASRHDNSGAFHRIATRDRLTDAPTRARDHSHLAGKQTVLID